MEKASTEIDLDEWEFLSDDGFLDLHHHEEEDRKRLSLKETMSGFYPKDPFSMNYFICPSPTTCRPVFETPSSSSDLTSGDQLLPVPVVGIGIIPAAISEKIKAPKLGAMAADQDTASQVFFKKLKENEFVDMNFMDSPKSTSVGIEPQTEEKEEAIKQETVKKEDYMDSVIKEEINWECDAGGLGIWKWRINGIGSLCSIGAVAATICMFIFGSHQRHKHHHQQLQFQIYADDNKSIKQVVNGATRLNQTLSAVSGVPLARAQISFGGYYDGL